jgi:hypothetical protein
MQLPVKVWNSGEIPLEAPGSQPLTTLVLVNLRLSIELAQLATVIASADLNVQ